MVQETEEKQSLGCETNDEKIEGSCKASDVSVSETVIAIPEDQLHSSSETVAVTDSENQSNSDGSSLEKGSFVVVDVKCGGDGEVWEGERVCRICHLDDDQELKGSSRSKTELIRLGCACNGELSLVHLYCAEAWFKLKGNRVCEICGEIVNNVRGVGNEMFMEAWIEGAVNGNALDSSERSREGCWHGQSFCNFLMACLVIAFVVPWFFRINMF